MGIIAVGPFMLDFDMLILVFSAAAGYAAIIFWQKRCKADLKIRGTYGNAIILGLLFWKFSLVIFDFPSVMRYPLSLLYYDGGWRGAVLGAALSILYLWLRMRKDGTPWRMKLEMAAAGWLAGSSLYFFLLMASFPEKIKEYALFVVIQGAAAWILFSKRQTAGNKAAFLLLLFMAGWGVQDHLYSRSGTEQAQPGLVIETGVKKGKGAPDFELQSLSGKPVRLSDYRGQKVILNFWASWCPPCKAEMPHMEKISQSHAAEAVVLGVNLTHTEKSLEAAGRFAQSYRLTFPILLDVNGTAADTYRIRAYPTTYIIDSSGIIREIFEGAISAEIMNKALSRIH
jgi:peroxiredoxin